MRSPCIPKKASQFPFPCRRAALQAKIKTVIIQQQKRAQAALINQTGVGERQLFRLPAEPPMADCGTLCERGRLRAELPKADAKIQHFSLLLLKPLKIHILLFFLNIYFYKIRQLEETKRTSPLLRSCILPPRRVTALPVENSRSTRPRAEERHAPTLL